MKPFHQLPLKQIAEVERAVDRQAAQKLCVDQLVSEGQQALFEHRKRRGLVVALDKIAAIPEEYKRLRNPEIYNAQLSGDLGATKASLIQTLGASGA